MKDSPYCLWGKEAHSGIYYRKIEEISQRVSYRLLEHAKDFLDDFCQFIRKGDKECLRSREEYGIELLLIGVMLKEYSPYGGAFQQGILPLFNILNKVREVPRFKPGVDKLRGKIITKVLLRKKSFEEGMGLEYLEKMIAWMKATGDFKEEVIRLKRWLIFLREKGNRYCHECLRLAKEEAQAMEKVCTYELNDYVANVDWHLQSVGIRYKDREDRIYCGKGKIQYFFNMVAAEIMNRVYQKRFLEIKIKKVFAPACMRQLEKEPMCQRSNIGYSCIGCNRKCYVHELDKKLKKQSIEIYIIPHETMLKQLEKEKKEPMGIVGIACVLNLVSGGWKALRLGFIPQCVLLDYCGCEKHWLDKGIMTSIHKERLYEVLKL